MRIIYITFVWFIKLQVIIGNVHNNQQVTNVHCSYDYSTRTFCVKPKSDLDHSYLKPSVISRGSDLYSAVCNFYLSSNFSFPLHLHHPASLPPSVSILLSFSGVSYPSRPQSFKSLGFGTCCFLLLACPSLLALAETFLFLWKPFPTSP